VSCGTLDSWLLYKYSGNHVTDVSNASRTMLMNLHTCRWSSRLLSFFGIPVATLPEIRSSSEVYGYFQHGVLKGIPFASCLGDQSASLLGQGCREAGQCGATFGTGCFLLQNTGLSPNYSRTGLLTTVAYKLGKSQSVVYALEGYTPTAGAAIRWLRDGLGIVNDLEEVEELATKVDDSGGVCFVPAFSGLHAPYWKADTRGVIAGLTQHSTKAHIVRACLEAICLQTRDTIAAISQDSEKPVATLVVTGGLCAISIFAQTLADILQCKGLLLITLFYSDKYLYAYM
jgi:glycerol kinase